MQVAVKINAFPSLLSLFKHVVTLPMVMFASTIVLALSKHNNSNEDLLSNVSVKSVFCNLFIIY